MLEWLLFCIPKILKNESNSQQKHLTKAQIFGCFVSQRYWKMKAIHNIRRQNEKHVEVVLYPKDTEKWKQFTTSECKGSGLQMLFCIPKILKNESNSQHRFTYVFYSVSCFVSQRYWKMKAIHNQTVCGECKGSVVLYPKDTEKWKQFTTFGMLNKHRLQLFCIPKILKNESNSQHPFFLNPKWRCCFVSQRYWKMKAIHN